MLISLKRGEVSGKKVRNMLCYLGTRAYELGQAAISLRQFLVGMCPLVPVWVS